MGRVYSWGLSLRGVTPTFFDSIYGSFVSVSVQRNSDLSIPEQLFTIRGSQGIVMGNTMQAEVGAELDAPVLVETSQSTGSGSDRIVVSRLHCMM